MKYSDQDGNLVDTEQMPEGLRPSGASYPSEGSVYSGGGNDGVPWVAVIVVGAIIFGVPAVKLAEALTKLLGQDSGYTTELFAGWAVIGGAAISANKLYKKYANPEAVSWPLAAVAVTGSLIYFAALTTPEQRQMVRGMIKYEDGLKEEKRKEEAREAQALREDPLLPVRRQRMEAAFARPSSRMFGTQTVGDLCGAFSAFPVLCTEYSTAVSVVDKIASKSASVSIVDRAKKSPLNLSVTKSSEGGIEHTLSMEGPGGNYRIRNYDPDVRAVAASVFGRFGISMDILDTCTGPAQEFNGIINGNRVTCTQGGNDRKTVSISISGVEPAP
jgi:hypothetical protein